MFVFTTSLSLWNGGLTALGSGGKYVHPATAAARSPGHGVPHPETQGPQTSSGFAGVLTWHNDNARDGQNLDETLLTLDNVNQAQFGQLFSDHVDGIPYAQPLYVLNVSIPNSGTHNVVYVATEHDSVYAFDADGPTRTALWKKSYINPTAGITTIPTSDLGCANIGPEVGITSTPVIDPTTNTMYVLPVTRENGNDVLRLHALDITTGVEKFGGPVTISAMVNGISFDPSQQAQRPSLLLANGTVYIGFGSYCDNTPYHGWLMGYSAATLAQTSVFLVTPHGTQGAIWNGGAAPAADSMGSIYVTTGNGTFDANKSGGKDFGNSFLKLSPTLSLLDYFTPFNQASLDTNDLDVGAAGVILLPEQAGAHPFIMISAGKEGRIYVVDCDNLGHFHSGSDSQIVQSIPDAFRNGTWATATYWNGNVYFGAYRDALKQYAVTSGRISSNPIAQDTDLISYAGATPSVSANGNTSGIVWLVDNKSTGAVLRAYDATDVSHKLYDSGPTLKAFAVKFAPPTIANGKVYVGTRSALVVFGLLALSRQELDTAEQK